MSVRKNAQQPSKFYVLDAALKLVTYTCNILTNEKIFIPRFQRIINKIADETVLIYHKCRVANTIDLRTQDAEIWEENARRRIVQEREALYLCEDLHSDIMIAQKLFHLKASRVEYWTRLVVETQGALKKWYKSELEKYNSKK